MFSALDWKALRPDLVNVAIYAGPWTGSTLKALDGVFDVIGSVDDVDRIALQVGQTMECGSGPR